MYDEYYKIFSFCGDEKETWYSCSCMEKMAKKKGEGVFVIAIILLLLIAESRKMLFLENKGTP